ncbi:MAG: hypothetical protein LAT63_05110 [Marinobacter sp.]|nr:hypothetical protein [Marinobacter sp.]
MQLFMFAVFAGGGAVNSGKLERWQLSVLDQSLFLLPGLSLVAGVMLVVGYMNGGSTQYYYWHLLPLAGAGAYLLFLFSLGMRH